MDKTRIAWHPGFASAMQLELDAYADGLVFETEHELNRGPLQIDLLVVKKDPSLVIENDVASAFRGHNILEFKSEQDSLNIDDLYKTVAYGCLYKSYGQGVDAIRADDVTLTLVRHGRPDGLFASLRAYGKTVAAQGQGVYRVEGATFPTQVVVTSELDPANHVWLSSLASDLKPVQLRRLADAAVTLDGKHERELADSVLDVVALANTRTIERMKEEDEMGKTLYEIMKPEIDEAVAKARHEAIKEGLAEGMAEGLEKGMELGSKEGRREATAATVRRMLNRGGFSEAEIAELSGATLDDVRELAAAMALEAATA